MIGPKTLKQTKRRTIGKLSIAQVNRNRQGVYDRDSHSCIVAGSTWGRSHPCAGVLTIQHAAGRGMGGSAKFDGPEWLRAMCTTHNTLETSDARFAEACKRMGWSVSRGRVDAGTLTCEMVPVRYPDGRDYILTPDFRRQQLVANDAETMREMAYGPRVLSDLEGRPLMEEMKRRHGDGYGFAY